MIYLNGVAALVSAVLFIDLYYFLRGSKELRLNNSFIEVLAGTPTKKLVNLERKSNSENRKIEINVRTEHSQYFAGERRLHRS